jgi:hypothetical protein
MFNFNIPNTLTWIYILCERRSLADMCEFYIFLHYIKLLTSSQKIFVVTFW